MPITTRREFMRSAIAGGTLLSLGEHARATAPLGGPQAPGYYRMRLGTYEVTIVNDGARSFPMPDRFVRNVPRDEALEAAQAAYMPPGQVTVPFNPTLINTGSKLILIDTGNGPVAGGPVGRLTENLAAAGVRPEDVDLVLISHLHPDHTNGLKTAQGTLAFPNAEIRAASPDWAFWMSDTHMARAADAVTQAYFANTRKVLADLKDRVRTFAWNEEVAPGITALAAPGHTPGHTAFAVASGSDRLLIQSDVTNIPAFFLQHPDWHVMYDYDADQAQATRHRFYDMAAAEKSLVVGYHFPFPSLGHVERAGSGYRLVPVAWSAAL
ncbi:MBL fold metallo-hydrolase [Methylobacterium sp. J-088]|uniref:MBL fold metallo-hydrolase n=1 Tax=Methylobacterium sp. J-088 TaxID=2836664 RepID=UPI001FB9B034|nr:MBL fold metallo-hydrolase [Methylobacterium sp. J-088]MCJ2066772.1 MBL fold metallo-hydrolase [Methylobacterium sp. J-088]